MRTVEQGLPTPIRELDNMLLSNTSSNTSRSHSPLQLSRRSSASRSIPAQTLNADNEKEQMDNTDARGESQHEQTTPDGSAGARAQFYESSSQSDESSEAAVAIKAESEAPGRSRWYS